MREKETRENKELAVASVFNRANNLLRDYGGEIHSHSGSVGVKSFFHDEKDRRGISELRISSQRLGEPVTIVAIRQFEDKAKNKALRREVTLDKGAVLGIRILEGELVKDNSYAYYRNRANTGINLNNLERWLIDAGRHLKKRRSEETVASARRK